MAGPPTATAALALLTATFPTGKARVRTFGVWSAMNAAGGALGVLIGGLLTEYAGWRWVMFVNVPMALCALVMAWRGIAAVLGDTRGGRPDALGAVLATAGMTLLVFGVVRTDQYPWTSPVTLTTLAVAAVLLAGFIHVERTTTREPLLRPGHGLGLLLRVPLPPTRPRDGSRSDRGHVPAVRARSGRRLRARHQTRLPSHPPDPDGGQTR
ncbi:MFS transporter [Nocardiopsis sp. FIRDI 009]|uniref:MFS transporter n=1 Tax=Nocardiopsis sp. FIRDI 009 TaxID=714197 RepID=UPI001E5E9187|nr:MFS transporter [Nocardiopsis sp. FIRDI 009]